MPTFRGAKLLMTASIAASLIIFMPLAAFADGGDDGGGADSPAVSDTTPPITSFTEAIDTLQFPLRSLVTDCNSGATGVTVEALPDSTSDDPPTSLLVSYNIKNGDTVDATIDQDFVNSCIAQASPSMTSQAKSDGATVLKDAAAVLSIG